MYSPACNSIISASPALSICPSPDQLPVNDRILVSITPFTRPQHTDPVINVTPADGDAEADGDIDGEMDGEIEGLTLPLSQSKIRSSSKYAGLGDALELALEDGDLDGDSEGEILGEVDGLWEGETLGEVDGLTLPLSQSNIKSSNRYAALGLADAEGETLGLADADGETLGLSDAEGDTESLIVYSLVLPEQILLI